MRYRLVNVPTLGQGAATSEFEALERARAMAARVSATYQKLVATIGEENALKALEEAEASLIRAEEVYAAAIRGVA